MTPTMPKIERTQIIPLGSSMKASAREREEKKDGTDTLLGPSKRKKKQAQWGTPNICHLVCAVPITLPSEKIKTRAPCTCVPELVIHQSPTTTAAAVCAAQPLQNLNRILQLVLEDNNVARPRRAQITHLEPATGREPAAAPTASEPAPHAFNQPTRNPAHDARAFERQCAQVEGDGDLLGPVFAEQDVFASGWEVG